MGKEIRACRGDLTFQHEKLLEDAGAWVRPGKSMPFGGILGVETNCGGQNVIKEKLVEWAPKGLRAGVGRNVGGRPGRLPFA